MQRDLIFTQKGEVNMKILNDEELKNIYGGGVIFKIAMGLITAGAFAIGVIDGYLRPLKCRI